MTMSDTLPRGGAAALTRNIDMKLEAVVIPVSDVERSKAFYSRLGWRLDADFIVRNDFRVVQFTPPASSCSIHFGVGLTSGQPGSASGLFLIVADIQAAHASLDARGVDIGDIFHNIGPGTPPLDGPDPARGSYLSYASFRDPDGNEWLMQEVTTRLPGRVDTATTGFASASDLAGALRRAEAAHGEHEKRTGQRDNEWPDWYAAYMLAEQAGTKLPV